MAARVDNRADDGGAALAGAADPALSVPDAPLGWQEQGEFETVLSFNSFCKSRYNAKAWPCGLRADAERSCKST